MTPHIGKKTTGLVYMRDRETIDHTALNQQQMLTLLRYTTRKNVTVTELYRTRSWLVNEPDYRPWYYRAVLSTGQSIWYYARKGCWQK